MEQEQDQAVALAMPLSAVASTGPLVSEEVMTTVTTQIVQLQLEEPGTSKCSTSSASSWLPPWLSLPTAVTSSEAPSLHPSLELDIVNPYRMVGVSTQEDMDIHVIQFKNRQMALNLEFRIKKEEELQEKIAQLEAKQEQKNVFFGYMSRHWSVLNTDILNLLCILDDPGAASKLTFKTQATEEFNLSDPLQQQPVHESLVAQMQNTTSWISQILFAFHQLYDKVQLFVGPQHIQEAELNQRLMSEFENAIKMHRLMSLQMWEIQDNLDLAKTKIQEYCVWLQNQDVRKADLTDRNKTLQCQVRELQASILQMKKDIDLAEKQKKRLEDEAQRRQLLLTSIERQVTLGREELERLHQQQGSYEAEIEAMGLRHEELEQEMKKARRMQEELKNVADADVVENEVYKQLQAKFSIMFNEMLRLRFNCEDARKKYKILAKVNQNQVQDMQKKTVSDTADLKRDAGQMQSSLSTIRMEYTGLLEKYTPVKEEISQNALIGREMRSLLPTLQDHNRRLSEDVALHKKKCEGLTTEIEKLNHDTKKLQAEYERAKKMKTDEAEAEPRPGTSSHVGTDDNDSLCDADAALIKELQAELAKDQAENQELRLLLDFNKSIGKDNRSTAQLRRLEAKAKAEARELKEELKKLASPDPSEVLQLTQEQANEQIAHLESQIRGLNAETARSLETERSLTDEVEAMGQNFDGLQAQNARLTEELTKTNANNMRIMSQGNKIGELTKQHWTEIKQLKEQVHGLNRRLAGGQETAKRLEAKTNSMMKRVVAGEVKGIERYKLSEKNRLATLQNVQSSADLQSSVDRAKSEWEEIAAIASEKEVQYESACAGTKTAEEEAEQLRREVEELEAAEAEAAAAVTATAGTSTSTATGPSSRQVAHLREISEYKTMLTCPSCKVARKDAFLSTCFHAFCYECLRTRYSNRDRKCPQCNRAFGATDYHRFQLE